MKKNGKEGKKGERERIKGRRWKKGGGEKGESKGRRGEGDQAEEERRERELSILLKAFRSPCPSSLQRDKDKKCHLPSTQTDQIEAWHKQQERTGQEKGVDR